MDGRANLFLTSTERCKSEAKQIEFQLNCVVVAEFAESPHMERAKDGF